MATVFVKASAENADLSEFDVSATSSLGDVITTNCTTSTTVARTGARSFRFSGSEAAVWQTGFNITSGFWLSAHVSHNGTASAGEYGVPVFGVWGDSYYNYWKWVTYPHPTPSKWELDSIAVTRFLAGVTLDGYRLRWVSYDNTSFPQAPADIYDPASQPGDPDPWVWLVNPAFYQSQINLPQGRFQHWAINGVPDDAPTGLGDWHFYVDGVEVFGGGLDVINTSLSGTYWAGLGRGTLSSSKVSGSLSNYTYFDDVYVAQAGIIHTVPPEDLRFPTVASTGDAPTPTDVVDAFGIYSEGEITPQVDVTAFGIYSEGEITPQLNVDAFGVYVQMMIVPTQPVIKFAGYNLSDWVQNAKLEATMKAIDNTHFLSTGTESVPGLVRWAFPFGGPWDATLDARLWPYVGRANQTFSIQLRNVIYSWTSAFLVDYTADVTSPRDGMQWMAAVAGIGAPSREYMT